MGTALSQRAGRGLQEGTCPGWVSSAWEVVTQKMLLFFCLFGITQGLGLEVKVDSGGVQRVLVSCETTTPLGILGNHLVDGTEHALPLCCLLGSGRSA